MGAKLRSFFGQLKRLDAHFEPVFTQAMLPLLEEQIDSSLITLPSSAWQAQCDVHMLYCSRQQGANGSFCCCSHVCGGCFFSPLFNVANTYIYIFKTQHLFWSRRRCESCVLQPRSCIYIQTLLPAFKCSVDWFSNEVQITSKWQQPGSKTGCTYTSEATAWNWERVAAKRNLLAGSIECVRRARVV